MENFGAVPTEDQEANSIRSPMSPPVKEHPLDPSDYIPDPTHEIFEHQSPEDPPKPSEMPIEGLPSSSDHPATRTALFSSENLVADVQEDPQEQTIIDNEFLHAHSSNQKQSSSLKLVLRRNVCLREKNEELRVLNTCLKTENNSKNVQNEHLRAKVARLKERQVIFFKKMHKTQRIVSKQKI